MKLLKNISFLLAGRVISLALGVVYYAALSRYIQAEGMGKLATATSLISLAVLVINFGLGELTVRDVAADRSRSSSYLSHLFLIRGALSLLFLLVVAAAAWAVDYSAEVMRIIAIYCLVFMFDEFSAICFSVFNAHERMEYSAGLQTGRDVVNIAASLIAISLQANLYVIVSISAIASLLKLAASLWFVSRIIAPFSPRLDLDLSRRILVSALPFAALTIISIVSMQLDMFVLSLSHPAEEVGWYSSARLIEAYLLIIPNIILQAVFPTFAKFNASSQEELRRMYLSSFRYLMLLGFGMFIGCLTTARQVVLLLFGDGFERSALLLQILSASFFWLFGYVNGTLLITTGQQNLATTLSAISMLITTLLSLTLIPGLGAVGAGIAHVFPGFLFFIPLIVICHRRLALRYPFAFTGKALLSAMFMGALILVTEQLNLHILLVVFLVAPTAYGAALWMTGALTCADVSVIAQVFKKSDLFING